MDEAADMDANDIIYVAADAEIGAVDCCNVHVHQL